MWAGLSGGFELLQGLGIFLFSLGSKPNLGSTLLPIQWGPGAPPQGVKQPGHEADHSPQSSVEVKNACKYISPPPTSSWRGAQLKHRDNFDFTFTLILEKWNGKL
jgi:hypothetical protein